MNTIINTILGIVASLSFMTPAWAAGSATTGVISQLTPLVLIMLIFYFLLIRPQQKRAKEHKNMVESLKKGDKVMTNGGIYGTLADVKDDIVKLEIADGVRIQIQRDSIVALSD